ncbi:DUF1127 domain-containing protein [Zavarzinia compransoris]|uniref:YjiS-like domain-containing protein n=1 Tax=Zavarzinia compransoris TaxID=1264899 RepID=A0A317E9Z4_9PROT|nr:DUF1127 domain-containing protein [Zavarzinia compransoris]PWR21955.1 hypothetical protein DKG75_08225 [Zavarzinia compransoris]TDP47307.1 uncharacterized protein YjiS (DUF1127 family) [Zavarzinia compransoris]
MTDCIETKSPTLPTLSPLAQTSGQTAARATVWMLAARAFGVLLDWQRRAMERNHLRGLDDHMLRDIGLSRADIEQEAAKPFWKP